MFLNPFMLAGLFAITIPVAIHLLNRRKTQRIVWAAMRFLQASVRRNQRRMRVQDILLLLMRCALVALLALIAARPALRAANGGVFGHSTATAVIILDNSYSMSETDGVTSNFARAQKCAEQILDSLTPGSATAILLASDTVDELIPQPTSDLDLARQTIREAKLTDRSTDLLAALQDAVEILSPRPAGQIHLITDDRIHGWRRMDSIHQLLNSTKDQIHTTITLFPPASQTNLAVTDLRIASPMPIAGRPTVFEARITNFSPTDAQNIPVRLSADNNPAADQIFIDRITPGQSRTVALSIRLDPGYHTLTASLPPHHLPADDTRTIAVRAVSKINVLLVDGSTSPKPQDSQVLFLRQALVPVPATDVDQYFLLTKTISPSDLPSTRLSDFDAVFLANLTDFPDPLPNSLFDYLHHGGSILLFPGPDTQPDSYNRQLAPILPASLAPSQDGAFTLSSQNLDPLLAQIWKDSAATILGSADITRRLPVHVLDESRILLQYSDHSPALIERTVGQGRILLFNSTANTSWNDLPLHAELFVPLIQQLLASLLSHQDENLNIPVGQHFIWHPPSELLGREATIIPPGPRPTPQSRAIALVGSRPTLDFSETSYAGPYNLIVADPPTHLKFAAQGDPEESDPQPLTAQQKNDLSKVATLVDSSTHLASTQLSDNPTGRALWLPLALLAIALACVETIASERFSRPK